MASSNNQNAASKKLSVNSETLKTNNIAEHPVQDPLVTEIGNCFEKSIDALGQHMTTFSNLVSKNVINVMSISDNPRIDKEEGTKKREK